MSTSFCEYSLICITPQGLVGRFANMKKPRSGFGPVRGFWCLLARAWFFQAFASAPHRAPKEQRYGQCQQQRPPERSGALRCLKGRGVRVVHRLRTNPDPPDRSTAGRNLSTRPKARRAPRALSFAPCPKAASSQPSALAEGIFRREILPWGLLGLALGLVEGATAAVLVKQHFAGAASVIGVNICGRARERRAGLLQRPELRVGERRARRAPACG